MKRRARQPVLLYLLIIMLGLGGVYALLAAGAQLFTSTVAYTTTAVFSGEYELAPDGTIHRIRQPDADLEVRP